MVVATNVAVNFIANRNKYKLSAKFYVKFLMMDHYNHIVRMVTNCIFPEKPAFQLHPKARLQPVHSPVFDPGFQP